MIVDGRSVVDSLSFDVCIVGAGPAGLSLARTLEGSAISVAVVERGGLEEPAEPSATLSGEIGDGLPYFPLSETRSMGFGGTSWLWPEVDGLRSRPLDPIDFEIRSDVPHSGWPFGFEELEPYYEAAHAQCGLSELDYDVATWATSETEPLEFAGEPFETAIFKFGSDIGVFQSMLSIFERSENLTVVLNTEVLELRRSEQEAVRVESVLVTAASNRFRVRARVFILAAGGLENARLLLLSRSSNPSGLGNQFDLVGRYFQEHLRINSGILESTDASLPHNLGFYRRHETHGHKIIAFLAPEDSLLRTSPILNTAIYLRTTSSLRVNNVFRSLTVLGSIRKKQWGLRDDPPWPHAMNLARHPLETVRMLFRIVGRIEGRNVIQLSLQTEQAPNPSSRVLLGSDVDEWGRPVARLDWKLTDLDVTSARLIQEHLDRAARRVGIGRVTNLLGTEEPPVPIRGFWHHMGTTRMSATERSGVVDANCRIHSVNNVFVAGSSVFPTGGYANPTLTIVALSIRLGRHLLRRLAA